MRVLFSRLILVLTFLLKGSFSFGQEAPNVIPPSPTAASLGKYGDIPVGLYTGIPSINVPLLEIKGNHLRLPISLSYHAAGVKVEENSSWVGLGWSLNAGGVITRTTRGLPDDALGGYLINEDIPAVPTMTNYFADVLSGNIDTEPDIFFFNFNGYAGKFYLEKKQPNSNVIKGYSIPYMDLQILCFYTPVAGITFSIKTEDGTEYIFSSAESTTTSTFYYNTKNGVPQITSNPIKTSASAYYLTEIRSSVGNEIITFSYEPEEFKYVSAKRGKIGYRASGTLDYASMYYTETTISGLRLSSIRSDALKTTVEFQTDKVREDLLSVNSYVPKALERIVLRHDDTIDPIRKFEFSTSYFSNQLLSGTTIPTTQHYLYKRLKLDEVLETSGDGLVTKKPFQFQYNNINLPPKNAETQDHWGFYNGPTNVFDAASYYSQHYMIPPFHGSVDHSQELFYFQCDNNPPVVIPNNNVSYLTIPGVNREPNLSTVQTGILNKVIYPTGGSTSLEYEAHSYGYAGNEALEKEIRETTQPGAYIERPFENNPTGDEIQEMEFQVAKDTLYKVMFEVEYSYKDQQEFESGRAYTRNEFQLVGEGLLRPLLRVYYDMEITQLGNIYTAFWKEEMGSALPLTLPITILGNSTLEYGGDLSETSGDGPDYGRRVATGFYVVRLRPGITYKVRALRQYSVNGNCPDLYTGQCFVNNNAVQGWFAEAFETGEVIDIKREFTAGGVRIKRRVDQASASSEDVVTEYRYYMSDGNGNEDPTSSGCLASRPDHYTTQYHEVVAGGSTGTGETISIVPGQDCELGWVSAQVYAVFSVDSDYQLPLSTTQGSHISYREVRVIQPGNGYTINKFQSSFEYPDEVPSTIFQVVGDVTFQYGAPGQSSPISYVYPFVPKNNNDWKRGFPTEISTYSEEGVRKRKESYVHSYKIKKVASAISTYFSGNVGTFTSVPWVDYVKYDLSAGWAFNSTKSVEEFTETSGDPVTIAFTYEHNSPNHIQMTKQTQTTSNGLLETNYIYSADRPSLPHTQSVVIDEMVEKNIINKVLKKEIRRNGTLIDGVITNFKKEEGNYIPSTLEILGTDASYEEKLSFEEYNSSGNILEWKKSNDVSNSYVWGHGNSIPIAEAVNATPDQIAYTSFESGSDGNWVIGGSQRSLMFKTGKQSFDLANGNVLKAGLLPNKRYSISLWGKEGATIQINGTIVNSELLSTDGWKFYHMDVTSVSSVNITGSGLIDELRLSPVESRMTTYSYDPLVGITSVSDSNGLIFYFKYDMLGRLLFVRDQDGNILKHYKYHYQEVQEAPEP